MTAHDAALAATQPPQDSASSWWCGAVSSETELLSAAVLCAAIANSRTTNSDDATATSPAERDAAKRELEAFIRNSPLPHKLQLPVVEYTSRYVIVESASAVICAIKATSTSDVVEAVLGSTLPLSQPYVYRYGGARIHLPFWKRAQQLDITAIYRQARTRHKTLLLCGHSIAGSIAQIGLCELVYQRLPPQVRSELEKRDAAVRKADLQHNKTQTSATVSTEDVWRGLVNDAVLNDLPHVMAMGFGSPYISSHALQRYLGGLNLTKRVVTLVNEFDCIPAILNVAQSAAMVTKTTERFRTITKATKTLLKFLPAQMQSVFVGMNAEKAAGVGMGSVTSAYVTMSLSILQNAFLKFRDLNVIKEIDYQYAPCGTYLFMKKESKDFQLLSESAAILKVLHEDDDKTSALTGNAILQHLMSAYVDAIARRSTSIQINESMNYYERLGIPKTADARQIRTAYKKSALKWHPDRWSSAVNPQEKEMAEHVFKLLAESYETLSDPVSRAAYDAHLAKGPSWVEEFTRQGTVSGMTLDEAISTFRDVLDGATGAVSHVTSRFTSSSSSSVVGQARIRRVDPVLTNNGLVVNNHNNLFAPDRIRVTRTIGIGADQQEKVLFLQPEEVMPGDIAAPTIQDQNAAGGAAANGMKTVSVLGGAVVVGASVALAVTAWNQYSESAKRSMQADAVRKMPGEYLMLLMDDHRAAKKTHDQSVQRLESKKPTTPAITGAIVEKKTELGTIDENNAAIVVRDQSAIVERSHDNEDDELVDEFFECLTGYEEAKLQAFAEDEFFECVDILEDLSTHFKPAIVNDLDSSAASEDKEVVEFPAGSAVSTPFGLGKVVDWRSGVTSAVIELDMGCQAFIQKESIKRGAALVLDKAHQAMEEKRIVLSERVVERFGLEKSQKDGGIRGLVQASKDGALDSGMRAAGGVVIAKGLSKASTTLGGAVAAPLTITSILVDIGKEYYEYRQKHTDRKNMGILSATNERLMMRDFRLKAGQHVVSGTAAGAGASLGAYSVASAVGFWTGVGITGPIGVVAATGAAVVGGMLGFFAGSKAYTGYTASYFTSNKSAKEHIDRLELGARILFNEHDPNGSGEISKTDCVNIITKLFEASGSVSESGYQSVLSVLQDERFEGPVAWPMFWEWVSSEAARSLRKLEEEEAAKTHVPADVEHESWWQSYKNYFSYSNAASPTTTPAIASPESAMYPSVSATLKLDQPPVEADVPPSQRIDLSELVVLRAQMEYLVNSGALTESDAFQLEHLLESDDADVRESAKKTIVALHEGGLDVESTNAEGGGIISDGFFGDGGDDETTSATDSTRASVNASPNVTRERSFSQEQAQLDVFCSLLSTTGLQHYLHSQHIEVSPETAARHEELHCLALSSAAPPASSL